MSKSKVTLAYPYTDADGKNHNPDTTLSLPDGEAFELLASGRARAADDEPKALAKAPAKAARKAPAKTAASTTPPADPKESK